MSGRPTRKPTPGVSSAQMQIDFDRYARDGWIENASIPDGYSDDGTVVKADKLKGLLLKLNSHLGKNAECYPSQSLLADRMSVCERTVRRATEVLQNLSLLIVKRKNIRGSRTAVNHYRIVWSELLLLDKDRQRAFYQSIGGQRTTEQPDVTTEQPDVTTEQPDVTTEQPDVASGKLLLNHSMNIPTNWEVVLGDLIGLGMSRRGAETAVLAAKDRRMSSADLQGLIETFRRQRPPIGFLHNWITGKSEPLDTGPRRSHSLTSATTRRELIRAPIVKAGRRAGRNDAEIEAEIKAAWLASGLVLPTKPVPEPVINETH